MTEAQLSKTLYTPLWVRARANRAASGLGFVDRAAEHLVSQLGKKLTPVNWPQAHCRNELNLCRWVDGCVQQVFERFPDALGVQPDAGLNTRFHRLSQALSWPRFQWVDINRPEVARWFGDLMPQTDNYRLLGSAQPLQQWQQLANRVERQPVILVLEPGRQSHAHPIQARHLRDSLLGLIHISQREDIPVYLVLTFPRKKFWQLPGSGLAYKDAQQLIAAMALPPQAALSYTTRTFGKTEGLFLKINDGKAPSANRS